MANDFGLTKDFDMFSSSNNVPKYELTDVETKNLQPYKNHPFKLYQGERFLDMVESIKANGLFSPVIVRPIENDRFNYEILSGHNRVEACKMAEIDTIPCIVKDDLTDEEAHLIVTESNLIQRSFADLSHSERASALATHYEAVKKQGKRNDLISQIENWVLTADKPQNEEDSLTLRQVGEKKNTGETLGEKYGLSPRNISRYLRINMLIQPLKEMLDRKEIGFVPAENLGYLKEADQQTLLDYITDNELTIDMRKAEQLKNLATNGKFTIAEMEKVFTGKKSKINPIKSASVIKFKRKKLDNYFGEDTKPEVIENTIIEALDFYFEYKDQIEKGGENHVQLQEDTTEDE